MEASSITRGLFWQTWVALPAPLNIFLRGDIDKAKKDMGIHGIPFSFFICPVVRWFTIFCFYYTTKIH